MEKTIWLNLAAHDVALQRWVGKSGSVENVLDFPARTPLDVLTDAAAALGGSFDATRRCVTLAHLDVPALKRHYPQGVVEEMSTSDVVRLWGEARRFEHVEVQHEAEVRPEAGGGEVVSEKRIPGGSDLAMRVGAVIPGEEPDRLSQVTEQQIVDMMTAPPGFDARQWQLEMADHLTQEYSGFEWSHRLY